MGLNEMRDRDHQRLPRENIEMLLEMTFSKPDETTTSQYQTECAICYT